MAWGFSNNAAAVEVNATGPVNVPYSSANSGEIIFLGMVAGPTGQSWTPADGGFSQIVTRTTNGSTALFWKIADGTETGTMAVTRSSNSGQCYGQMCTFTGGPLVLAGNVHATATIGSGATTGLLYPNLTVTQDSCLIITLGMKPANCSGFDVPAPFDAEIAENHTSLGLCMVWDYAIQTVATSITSGGWTITTDVSTSRQSVIAALIPAPLVLAPPTSGGIFVCP